MKRKVYWFGNDGCIRKHGESYQVFWYEHSYQTGHYLLFISLHNFNDLRKQPLAIGDNSSFSETLVGRYNSIKELKQSAQEFVQNYEVFLNEDDKKKISNVLYEFNGKIPDYCNWIVVTPDSTLCLCPRKPIFSNNNWKFSAPYWEKDKFYTTGVFKDLLSVPWDKTCIMLKEIYPYMPNSDFHLIEYDYEL